MKIAVLSGKGGAGKTFAAVNLACVALEACYVDCDVEEPNGHLFLKPLNVWTQRVSVMVPVFDVEKCTGCRVCVDFCRYNALALARGKVLHFKEACHSCGGCVLLCPAAAADYSTHEIGMIREGKSGGVRVLTGVLDAGEATGVPIIRELAGRMPKEEICVIDCPPGSACPVMESIKEADYCLLVAEPTAFGVHDLAMALELVRLFEKPAGALLNKCLPGENPARKLCMNTGLDILAEIPFDLETGRMISGGEAAVLKSPFLKAVFLGLLAKIKEEMQK